MTQIAFVLIHAESVWRMKALNLSRRLREVGEAYSVYGVFNVIAKMKPNSMDELKDIVDFKIRMLNKVRTLWTLIVIK